MHSMLPISAPMTTNTPSPWAEIVVGALFGKIATGTGLLALWHLYRHRASINGAFNHEFSSCGVFSGAGVLSVKVENNAKQQSALLSN